MPKHYYIKNKTEGKGTMFIGVTLLFAGMFFLEIMLLLFGGLIFTIGWIINWWHN